jgi:hypothetical protein
MSKAKAAKSNAKAKAAAPKTNQKASVAASTSKANAKKTAQPGIIASIMQCLTDAKSAKKPLTAGEIHQKLTKLFPDREATGMMVTVRAQLSRLPNEKDFAITKKRDGRVVTYSAA